MAYVPFTMKRPHPSASHQTKVFIIVLDAEGGNAVNFIIENEKLSFVEAIQQLGQQLGIPVEFSGGGESKNLFDSLYSIHELVLVFITKRSYLTEAQKH